ncbi:MAG: restriction endonuclease [Aestuariivita sp.]|nr:restriction endonuclease [Aestuariivita sp.]
MNSQENPDFFTVFRTDDDEWIFREITQGRLRQGWGADGLSLISRTGTPVDKLRWEKKYLEVWREQPSSQRFAILSRMLDLKKEDIVVIPKMPEWNEFTIARVSGKYHFEVDTDRKDFGHIIPIDSNSIRTFNYQEDYEAFLVSSTFARANHRPAISWCYNSDQIDAACKLLKRKGSSTARPMEEMFQVAVNKAFKEAASKLQEMVKNWNGDRFEKAIRQAFQNQGYQFKRSRRFDGEGGDIDMLFSPPLGHALFLPSEISVQVKWKQGKDQNDDEAVKQVIQWAKSQSSNARKYVISSASSFTEDACTRAADHDVILIYGLETMCFLLGAPEQYREDWDS